MQLPSISENGTAEIPSSPGNFKIGGSDVVQGNLGIRDSDRDLYVILFCEHSDRSYQVK
jgi:hypothetical protein